MVCHDPNCGNMYLNCSNVCEVASGLLRKDIKKASFFRTLSKRGGRDQPESKSFEVVLFSPSLTFFWTLNGGRGG